MSESQDIVPTTVIVLPTAEIEFGEGGVVPIPSRSFLTSRSADEVEAVLMSHANELGSHGRALTWVFPKEAKLVVVYAPLFGLDTTFHDLQELVKAVGD